MLYKSEFYLLNLPYSEVTSTLHCALNHVVRLTRLVLISVQLSNLS